MIVPISWDFYGAVASGGSVWALRVVLALAASRPCHRGTYYVRQVLCRVALVAHLHCSGLHYSVLRPALAGLRCAMDSASARPAPPLSTGIGLGNASPVRKQGIVDCEDVLGRSESEAPAEARVGMPALHACVEARRLPTLRALERVGWRSHPDPQLTSITTLL